MLRLSLRSSRNDICSSLPPGTTLVQAFNQFGPEITNDVDTVRALLLRFGVSDSNPPRDAQVIEYMSTLARQAAEGSTLGDVNAFVRALSSYVSCHHFIGWSAC